MNSVPPGRSKCSRSPGPLAKPYCFSSWLRMGLPLFTASTLNFLIEFRGTDAGAVMCQTCLPARSPANASTASAEKSDASGLTSRKPGGGRKGLAGMKTGVASGLFCLSAPSLCPCESHTWKLALSFEALVLLWLSFHLLTPLGCRFLLMTTMTVHWHYLQNSQYHRCRGFLTERQIPWARFRHFPASFRQMPRTRFCHSSASFRQKYFEPDC